MQWDWLGHRARFLAIGGNKITDIHSQIVLVSKVLAVVFSTPACVKKLLTFLNSLYLGKMHFLQNFIQDTKYKQLFAVIKNHFILINGYNHKV